MMGFTSFNPSYALHAQRRRPVDADQKGPAAAGFEIFQAHAQVTALSETPQSPQDGFSAAKPIAFDRRTMMDFTSFDPSNTLVSPAGIRTGSIECNVGARQNTLDKLP